MDCMLHNGLLIGKDLVVLLTYRLFSIAIKFMYENKI